MWAKVVSDPACAARVLITPCKSMDWTRQKAWDPSLGRILLRSMSNNGLTASSFICFRVVTTDIPDCHHPLFITDGCFIERDSFGWYAIWLKARARASLILGGTWVLLSLLPPPNNAHSPMSKAV